MSPLDKNKFFLLNKDKKKLNKINEVNINDNSPEILLYFGKPLKGSGGLQNFALFFKLLKKMNFRVKYCPLLENIDSLNFQTPLHKKTINKISQNELYNYFNETEILKSDIVTIESLRSKNNVIIYSEDVIGNPTQQNYVVRWIHFFPLPNSVKNYNLSKDQIWFFSDYIYNLYDNLCKNLKLENYFDNYIQNPQILRVFKFDYNKYKNLWFNENSISTIYTKTNENIEFIEKLELKIIESTSEKDRINFERKGIAYVDRKFYPPHTFLINKYIKDLRQKNELEMKNEMKNNYLLKWGEECQENFNLFFRIKKFISYDRFTFLNIMASLNGCLSIVKPIENLDADTWRNAEPFHKYGIAYGEEEKEINYALSTQDKLYNHIYNMFLENENNIKNFIESIENSFNITLHI